ncbi:fungal-specific transcription factor domain-containing protein [Talaromyces proteolyticus]|uniref:Fungal-specific transcription factor domain-containing protein n=1 Tax=Talaromyces proteolyticus TaxID=1131652 RepID=A0AAD4KFQ8_9EURO|nr:fungal-specific transcription factor domain-containing protein [Talaromyces proteolyticus]KAH8690626.1 fungal-specific transcription factor domain-containing protein [Talaromyces proteolyticus]
MAQGENCDEAIGEGTDRDRPNEPEEFPACQSCRKRKLKCSREAPACSQCSRLSILEGLLLNGERTLNGVPNNATPDMAGCVYHAALLVANSAKAGVENTQLQATSLDCKKRHLSVQCTETACATSTCHATKKRRKEDSTRTAAVEREVPLPGQDTLRKIVKTYFSIIHPWLPCVHQPTFERRLENLTPDDKLLVLVHGMICVTLRHMNIQEIGMDEAERDMHIRVSRDTMIKMAIFDMSIESLQALIILASDRMGYGDLAGASPIIGSLTRTVEYLQLSIEVDEKSKPLFLRPIVLLEDAQTWTESEERRRIFWNVFILDRLCSAIAGWSTSLTSSDVRRRLPCDGKMWARGESALTPYFGIWDKSAAKIGNPISSYNMSAARSPSSSESSRSHTSPASESVQVGAFAYRIEATESLCQVTTFFLQQPVDFSNRQEVSGWLMRFKELDLRLVHWKYLLPSKWNDSNISRDETIVKMDPNLTLAHVTHNTSMILLHQHIAYPPDQLRNIVRLPSSCSAETCQLAAIETSSIAQKFLTHSASDIVVAQFPFCVFIAARVLLVHWKFHATPLVNEYFDLLKSLKYMSRRWQGYLQSPKQRSTVVTTNETHQDFDIAGRYAALLEALHSKCINEPELEANNLFHDDIITGLDISRKRTHAFSELVTGTQDAAVSRGQAANVDESVALEHSLRSWKSPAKDRGSVPENESGFVLGESPSFNRVPTGNIHGNGYSDSVNSYRVARPSTAAQNPIALGLNGNANDDELTMMSNMLLDNQFSQMDRVITLSETDFAWDWTYAVAQNI